MTTCRSATPVAGHEARLMSRFGMRRGRTTGEMRMHAGVDIGAPRGASVFAVRPGIIVLIGRNSDRRGSGLYGYGNAVVVYHPDEQLYSFYAHLSSVDVREGQNVDIGQPLGVIGATTNGKFPGMGRHLHMEVRRPKDDGSNPFPGAYGRYNMDPALWMQQHGLAFSRDGMMADPTFEACLSPIPVERSLDWLTRDPGAAAERGRSSGSLFTRPMGDVGGQIWAIRSSGLAAPATADLNDDYEPPVPDPDFFKPVKPIIKAIPLAALFAAGMAGIAIALD